jgi:hypothetical protein
MGRCGDIDGVWIEPVTAQVMMTFRDLAMGVSSRSAARLQSHTGARVRHPAAGRRAGL